MGYVAVISMSYLLGSLNLAYFIAKYKKADLRGNGSGNLGASNTTSLLGWKWGILVALHDIGKALIAVLIARFFFRDLPLVGAVAGVSAVMGHIFPFYLKFKGGKGFASFLGMTIALNWKLALVIMALVIVITVITDYIFWGTLTTIITVPAYMGFVNHSLMLMGIISLATAVIFLKHQENITRLRNHTEIGLKSAIRGENRVK